MAQVTQVAIVAVSKVSNRMPLARLLCYRSRKWCSMDSEELSSISLTRGECRERECTKPYAIQLNVILAQTAGVIKTKRGHETRTVGACGHMTLPPLAGAGQPLVFIPRRVNVQRSTAI